MLAELRNWIYEKFTGTPHDNWYTLIDENGAFDLSGKTSDMLLYSQNHPILSGAMLFVCNLFAQAEFKIVRLDGSLYNGPLNDKLRVMSNPNYYQSRIDFLEALLWMKIARGCVPIYMPKRIGFPDEVIAMYVLDPYRIEWPSNFRTPMSYSDSLFKTTVVKYKESSDTEPINIKLNDLVFMYDMPNILVPTNKFKTSSRLDGLKQTLDNTVDSLVAKNIILRSNGKEMLTSSDANGFPMDAKDEEEARRIFNVNYGLAPGRNRSLITKANVKWQSLHIALRDLGLDESTKVDGNIVYTALHIPKDILSLEAKKTTYNNFRESMTSFIQNDITAMVNDLSITLSGVLLPSNLKLVGTYDHLPVMGYLEKEKAEAENTRADALAKYLALGMDQQTALELCGLDKNIKITKPEQTNEESSQSNSTG